jgi:hypothetical protein
MVRQLLLTNWYKNFFRAENTTFNFPAGRHLYVLDNRFIFSSDDSSSPPYEVVKGCVKSKEYLNNYLSYLKEEK